MPSATPATARTTMHDAQAVTTHSDDTPLQVLLIEDNPGDARLFEEYLREGTSEIDFRWEQDLASGLNALTEQAPNVVVLDLALPDSDGIDTVRRCTDAASPVPVVVLTGHADMDVALEAQRAGATEYLQKGELSPTLVERTLRWAHERARMQGQIRRRETRFQGLANSIPGVAYQFYARPGGEYGFSFVGERAEEVLGVSADSDDFFERVMKRVPDDHKQPLMDSIDKVVEEETTWRVEFPFEKPSGEQIWLLGTSTPSRQENELVFNGVLLDITERKRAEAKTRIQNRVFKEVMEGRPLPEILSDLVRSLEQIRPGMLGSILLHDPEEAQIQHGAAPSLPDAYNQALDGLGTGPAVGSCGTAMHTGEVVITKDIEADPRWEGYRDLAQEHGLRACWSVPIQGAGGGVLGTFAMYHREPKQPSEKDRALIEEACSLAGLAIERHRETQELRLMSEAVEQAKESVLVTEAAPLDEPGPRIEYVNSAFEETTGYDREEVLGKTPRILQGPGTERAVLDALSEALEAGEEWQGETINYRKDGTPYRVQWNVAPVRGEDGEIEYWVSLQRDVTEQRRQEEKLRLLARALEQVGDKVFITDPEGRIQYVNDAFEQITGYREEEVLGKTPSLLQSGAHQTAFYEELWDAISAGETFRAEMTNEKKDGTRYVEDESIAPVTNEEGEVTHFVSSGRDITERKEREDQLREAKEEAERMNRLKSAFLANMSHEIRTPLTSILGFAEAIGEQIDTDEEEATIPHFARLIEKSGQRLMETLNGVLNLSKLEAGEMSLAVERIDLQDEAAEMIEQFSPQADEAGIDLRRELEPAQAQASREGVHIILRNLISNALKYTDEGGTVTVLTDQDGETARLEVVDTGVGMDPEDVPDLFRAFAQESEGIGRKYEGTGLGLTLVQKTVDRLGGDIEVETEKGVGSRFTVQLPAAEGAGDK